MTPTILAAHLEAATERIKELEQHRDNLDATLLTLRKEYIERAEVREAQITYLQTVGTAQVERIRQLEDAVQKFLIETSAIPPWESAGAIWGMRIKELQMSWLDSKEAAAK